MGTGLTIRRQDGFQIIGRTTGLGVERPANQRRNATERDALFEKGRNRHLVGGIEHGRSRPAGAARLQTKIVRLEHVAPHPLERQRARLDRVEPADSRIGQPLRVSSIEG